MAVNVNDKKKQKIEDKLDRMQLLKFVGPSAKTTERPSTIVVT